MLARHPDILPAALLSALPVPLKERKRRQTVLCDRHVEFGIALPRQAQAFQETCLRPDGVRLELEPNPASKAKTRESDERIPIRAHEGVNRVEVAHRLLGACITESGQDAHF